MPSLTLGSLTSGWTSNEPDPADVEQTSWSPETVARGLGRVAGLGAYERARGGGGGTLQRVLRRRDGCSGALSDGRRFRSQLSEEAGEERPDQGIARVRGPGGARDVFQGGFDLAVRYEDSAGQALSVGAGHPCF